MEVLHHGSLPARAADHRCKEVTAMIHCVCWRNEGGICQYCRRIGRIHGQIYFRLLAAYKQ